MNLEALYRLRAQYPRPTDTLRLGLLLRKQHAPEEAIALLQQLEAYWDALRLQAFERPEHLLYEPEALQMASRWPLARRRAELLAARFPPGLLVEIGAGIGGDTLELARVRPLRACEQNPLRLARLRHNLQVYGLADRVELVQGDGLEHLQGAAAVYADPARRDGGGRQWKQLVPDPRRLWELTLPVCLKLAPGLEEAQLPAPVDIDYVSHQNVCKEAVVWRDAQARGEVRGWRYLGDSWIVAGRTAPPECGPIQVGDWLHEPDPAAIRAQLWLPAGGKRIDESLALLVTPAGVHSPWTAAFEVLEVAGSDLESLKKLQKRYDFQPLEIKKRGFDVEPEQLRARLPKGRKGGPGVLFLTRVAGRHVTLVCRRQLSV